MNTRDYIERLKWRSRRSMLELDLIFDSYVKSGALDNLSGEYLDKYNDLLELDDGELLLLFNGKHRLVNAGLQCLIDKIKSCNITN